MTVEGRLLDWSWAGIALEGDESGDVHVIAEFEHGVLVGVVDGLGHGFEAAAAARTAARVLRSFAGEPLVALVERCHEALRRTRGAVMSLASFDARAPSMTWGGIGNVEGLLLRASPASRPRESIVLRGGIVGYHLPSLHAATLAVAPGDVLILATDGVDERFGDDVTPGAPPREVADAILARHARGTDDALVLVARYLGGARPPAQPGGGTSP